MLLPKEPVLVYIALGGNLGDPPESFKQALAFLAQHPEIKNIQCSRLYRSTPIGVEEPQPDYINAAARFETTFSATALLETLMNIEFQMGRRRIRPHAPRTIDLDLLLYGADQIQETGLTVPHPRIHERAFVLLPLMDLNPDLEIPGQGVVKNLITRVVKQPICFFG